jgi:hypothetical protein
MRRTAFEPCLPTPGKQVPAGPAWLHEIKHDGYRLMVQREGKRVWLFTRNGHDWTDRYPLIVEAALKNRSRSFVIDGEAVLLGVEEGWLSAFRLSPMPSRTGQRAAPVVVSEEGLAAGGGAWLTAVDPGVPLGPGLLATCVVFHGPHVSIATASMTTAITANVRKCMRLSALVSNPDFKLSW